MLLCSARKHPSWPPPLRERGGENIRRSTCSTSTPLSRSGYASRTSAAFGSCVTITIVLPCSRFSTCSRPRMSSADWRSRSPVGSSQISRVGSETMAQAIATRCCWPPESSAGRVLCRAPSAPPSSSAISALRGRCGERTQFRQQQRQFDVLLRGQGRHQVVELEHRSRRGRCAIARAGPSSSGRCAGRRPRSRPRSANPGRRSN